MSIQAEKVTKIYKMIDNENRNGLKQIFAPRYKYIKAVDEISFQVRGGEFVGYIGLNGAGKSTTLKMLSGIVTPTSGEVIVNGLSPSKNRKTNLNQIGVVFGQRSHLLWDLPVIDTFDLYYKMYNIQNKSLKDILFEFNKILDISDFINQPARQLSLGQKMKANILIALMHNPKILFFDEPTIGLDVLSKDSIKKILKEINKSGTTIILTTHDMYDIQDLCNRIILIDKGTIEFDGLKDNFLNKYSAESVVKVTFLNNSDEIQHPFFTKLNDDAKVKMYSFDKSVISELDAIKHIVNSYNIIDIKIEYITLEHVVKKCFSEQ